MASLRAASRKLSGRPNDLHRATKFEEGRLLQLSAVALARLKGKQMDPFATVSVSTDRRLPLLSRLIRSLRRRRPWPLASPSGKQR